ncbi:hypothetical protein V6N13_101512 [Hibiscus sabdariffa]|uniref:BHLH domain-containing protein n=1 Tax=Hibiscus sabdariffa TaxID=183260 RepID=A0ABR2QLU7_9ROSI
MNSCMEISSTTELPELGLMEDPNSFSQWHMNSLDELSVFAQLPVSASSFGDNPFCDNYCYSPAAIDRPPKQLKTSGTRISQTNHHIMAERKRRERLSQKFIALSALVPGLKKMDKVTVLGDAIKYLKQLQEKVKTLEEQARQKSIESVVFVKKRRLLADTDEDFSAPFDEPLPEIEARYCDKSVLVRIYCEKRKGFPEKIISEIEKLLLTVVSSNVTTFGSSAVHITIVAQMDMGFCMTVKDLVKKLNAAFKFLK